MSDHIFGDQRFASIVEIREVLAVFLHNALRIHFQWNNVAICVVCGKQRAERVLGHLEVQHVVLAVSL